MDGRRPRAHARSQNPAYRLTHHHHRAPDLSYVWTSPDFSTNGCSASDDAHEARTPAGRRAAPRAALAVVPDASSRDRPSWSASDASQARVSPSPWSWSSGLPSGPPSRARRPPRSQTSRSVCRGAVPCPVGVLHLLLPADMPRSVISLPSLHRPVDSTVWAAPLQTGCRWRNRIGTRSAQAGGHAADARRLRDASSCRVEAACPASRPRQSSCATRDASRRPLCVACASPAHDFARRSRAVQRSSCTTRRPGWSSVRLTRPNADVVGHRSTTSSIPSLCTRVATCVPRELVRPPRRSPVGDECSGTLAQPCVRRWNRASTANDGAARSSGGRPPARRARGSSSPNPSGSPVTSSSSSQRRFPAARLLAARPQRREARSRTAPPRPRTPPPRPPSGRPARNRPGHTGRGDRHVRRRARSRCSATACATARAATSCSRRSSSTTAPRSSSIAAGSARTTSTATPTRSTAPTGEVTVRGPVGAAAAARTRRHGRRTQRPHDAAARRSRPHRNETSRTSSATSTSPRSTRIRRRRRRARAPDATAVRRRQPPPVRVPVVRVRADPARRLADRAVPSRAARRPRLTASGDSPATTGDTVASSERARDEGIAMPYAEGRTYYDADSHLMELGDWLVQYADPDVRDRIRPLALGGAGKLADEGRPRRRGAPRRSATPRARTRSQRDGPEGMERARCVRSGRAQPRPSISSASTRSSCSARSPVRSSSRTTSSSCTAALARTTGRWSSSAATIRG